MTGRVRSRGSECPRGRRSRAGRAEDTRSALALIASGVIAECENDPGTARWLYGQGLAICRELRNPWLGAFASGFLSRVEAVAERLVWLGGAEEWGGSVESAGRAPSGGSPARSAAEAGTRGGRGGRA